MESYTRCQLSKRLALLRMSSWSFCSVFVKEQKTELGSFPSGKLETREFSLGTAFTCCRADFSQLPMPGAPRAAEKLLNVGRISRRSAGGENFVRDRECARRFVVLTGAGMCEVKTSELLRYAEGNWKHEWRRKSRHLGQTVGFQFVICSYLNELM